MNSSQKLAIARKISLLLDGEEVQDPEIRADILLAAARAEVNQHCLIYLASGSESLPR
nr:hypothetical protein [uncultured Holophaga sp.]